MRIKMRMARGAKVFRLYKVYAKHKFSVGAKVVDFIRFMQSTNLVWEQKL